eukprot:GGOE01023962.1.p1 GENE.GGOE01023962.1~~GGOE01023962.1.p1  ORF type:complete len:543 (-),score=148.62 GGOE01023962.1:232-1860(-)
MAQLADGGRQKKGFWQRAGTDPSQGPRSRLSGLLRHHPPSRPQTATQPVQECDAVVPEEHRARHYVVKSVSTASHGLFSLLGHDFDSETDKIWQEYYKLDPFAAIQLDGLGPLPHGCSKAVVHCTSTYTGKEQAIPPLGPNGWSVTFKVADRLCDLTVLLLAKSGKVRLMTGVQVPSIDLLPTVVDLPLMMLPGEREGEAAAAGTLRVRLSVTYDRDVEKKNMWQHLVPVQELIYPEMDWDDVVLAIRSARARILLRAESSGLASRLEGWNRLLLFDNPWKSVAVFGAVMCLNGVIGHYRLWVPGLFALIVLSFLLGFLRRDFWMESVCKPSHVKSDRVKKPKQDLGRVLVSTAWLNWRVFDRFLALATWQHPRSSFLCLLFFLGCFLLTFVLPGWLMLNFLLTVYLSISGRLTVTVHCAHGFRSSDYISTDPYVVVMVGQQMNRTKSRLKEMHPLFEETMQFLVFSPNSHIQVCLWDWDRSSSDDFLGEGQFQTTGVIGCTTSKSNVWVDIRPRPATFADYKRFVSGRVRVSWKLEDITPT